MDLAPVPPAEGDQIASGGFDALVFTAGIGEHATPIRERVHQGAAWLGVELDLTATAADSPRISRADRRIPTWIIPTHEELMMGSDTKLRSMVD